MKLFIYLIIILLSRHTYSKNLIGRALSVDTQKLLYIEKHQIENDSNSKTGLDKKIITTYEKTDGQVFATMITDFSKNHYIPDITFIDHRFSLVENQLLEPDKNKIILTQSEAKATPITKELQVIDKMVSGQGFNNYIKENFNQPSEAKIQFNFIVLSKMEYFNFEIHPGSISHLKTKLFSLKPGNFIFQFFTNPIEVTYDTETKSLMQYKGLSNIMSDQRKNQEVLIKYQAAP